MNLNIIGLLKITYIIMIERINLLAWSIMLYFLSRKEFSEKIYLNS